MSLESYYIYEITDLDFDIVILIFYVAVIVIEVISTAFNGYYLQYQ